MHNGFNPSRLKQESEGKTRKTDKRSQQKGERPWFKTGDSMLTQNFSLGPKRIPGIIASVTGPVSYKVMLGDGRVVRRHVDQIHSHHQRPETCNSNQKTVSIQLSQADEKNEAWLEAEEVVLSGDKLEEPAGLKL